MTTSTENSAFAGVDAEKPPTVSVIIPCRNEADHIESTLQSILAQVPPPGGFEVIIADGMSTDGTREIITQLAKRDGRLRLVDNVQQITPCGMNVGIRASRGKYIGIMGAHTEYAPDYILQCIKLLEQRPEISCSGGPIISQGQRPFGKAVAAAMSHPVGIGNAKHRIPSYEGYAEGACFPMFRREVFDRVGLYDENLPRNQDDDLNYRLAKIGGKVFISPQAWSRYWVRESVARLFAQYFQYGYWRVVVLRKHHLPASWRQLAPIGFYLLMIFLLFLGLALTGTWRFISIALPLVYALTLLCAGIATAFKDGVRAGMLFPLAASTMHFAYAVGFIWNIVQSFTESYLRLHKLEA